MRLRSHRPRAGEVRRREHAAVVRDVGGVAEAVVVLVAGAVVAVVAAAQADARGPGAERLDAEEEVGEAEAVDAVVPAARVRGHRAAPGLADVAHVVLVVEVQAGEAEVDALGAGEGTALGAGDTPRGRGDGVARSHAVSAAPPSSRISPVAARSLAATLHMSDPMRSSKPSPS